MKFKDIKESVISKEPHIVGMYHDIYQNCQPFLKEIENRPAKYVMYRGLKYITYKDEDVGIKNARLTNRLPIDTDTETHNALNTYLTQEYGHPFRNGVFVSGNPSVAESYSMVGEPFAIFPIGEFEYLWHPAIKDFYSGVLDNTEYAEYFEKYTDEDIFHMIVRNEIGTFEDKNLTTAIQYKSEIMLWVEQYYFMNPAYLDGFEAWINKISSK